MCKYSFLSITPTHLLICLMTFLRSSCVTLFQSGYPGNNNRYQMLICMSIGDHSSRLCGSTLHLSRIYCTNQVPIFLYIHSLLFQVVTKSAMFCTFIYPFSFYITDIKDDHFQQHDEKCWAKDFARWKEGHVKTLNWRVQNRYSQKT